MSRPFASRSTFLGLLILSLALLAARPVLAADTATPTPTPALASSDADESDRQRNTGTLGLA